MDLGLHLRCTLSLPADSFLASLLAFNVGVEIGQITFLILLWMRLPPVSKRAFYQRGVAMPLNGLAALVAVYWIVERMGSVYGHSERNTITLS